MLKLALPAVEPTPLNWLVLTSPRGTVTFFELALTAQVNALIAEPLASVQVALGALLQPPVKLTVIEGKDIKMPDWIGPTTTNWAWT
ncbi:hypothetical protein D3C71_1597170 [compost metagenome]